MNANRNAPVYAFNQIEISADPSVVWGVGRDDRRVAALESRV
jgi:hypothetical protein